MTALVMQTFSEFAEPAMFFGKIRNDVNGNNAGGAGTEVKIILDDARDTMFTASPAQATSDTLAYADMTTAPLNTRSCIGGVLATTARGANNMRYRVEDWALAGYTDADRHIELKLQEIGR